MKTGGFIIQTREPHKAVISVLYWPTFILTILTSIWKNTPYASIREKKDTSPKNTSNSAVKCKASLKVSRTYKMQMPDYSLGMSM